MSTSYLLNACVLFLRRKIIVAVVRTLTIQYCTYVFVRVLCSVNSAGQINSQRTNCFAPLECEKKYRRERQRKLASAIINTDRKQRSEGSIARSCRVPIMLNAS